MNRTQIEWVKNPDGSQGYTWNPITGCLNHDNGLCKGGGFPCYAYKLAHGRLIDRYKSNHNILQPAPDIYPDNPSLDPFYPRFWGERLAELTRRNDRLYYDGKKTEYPISPRGIFVCDMGDVFGNGVPEQWTEKVLDEIWGNKSYDRFYLLTKQPDNLIKFSPFPENCWVGVTATNTLGFVDAHNWLHDIRASVKFVSLEPFLDWDAEVFRAIEYSISDRPADWLIIGACTGTHEDMFGLSYRDTPITDDRSRIMPLAKYRYTYQPKIEWVREIVEAADKAGIKVFLKDNLKPILPWEHPFIGDQYRYRQFRQEMPEEER